MKPRLTSVAIIALLSALLVPSGAKPSTRNGSPAAGLSEAYVHLCSALTSRDGRALVSWLAPHFELTEPNGSVRGGATLRNNFGALRLGTTCRVTIIARRTSRGGAHIDAVWLIKGDFASGASLKHLSVVEQTRDWWILHGSQWQLRSEVVIALKQWLDGQMKGALFYMSPRQHSAIIADLRKWYTPLRTAYPGGNEGDLAPILRAVGTARVIAMGEGSHGTSEFFALKDRVFRYLVEHDGVTVFAQETNWSDGENIDHYIQTGQGNLRDLLAATFPVWDNQETLDLLRWMRSYNVAHPHTLHFFGIDMQQPADAAGDVVTFYQKFDPRDAASVAGSESCIRLPLMTLMTRPLADAPACAHATRATFEALASDGHLRALAGRSAYLTAVHAADVAQEAASTYARTSLIPRAAARDKAMAQNVEWLVHTRYPRAKVFLWAHNGHVGVGMEAWPSMGTYLRAALGRNYFAIGQTFDHGGISLAVLPPITVPQSAGNDSEVMFRQVGRSPFFLNFHDVPPTSALGRWLSEPHGIREIGGVANLAEAESGEAEVRLPSAFDAITFVEMSHPAQSFEVPVERHISLPAGASGAMAAMPWELHSFVADSATSGAVTMPDGALALYLTADPAESRTFGMLESRLDAAPYRGKRLRVSGMLATTGVTVGALLMVRVFGVNDRQPLVYGHGPSRMLSGTEAWAPFSVMVDVPQTAKVTDIDLLLYGAGTVWCTNLTVGAAK